MDGCCALLGQRIESSKDQGMAFSKWLAKMEDAAFLVIDLVWRGRDCSQARRLARLIPPLTAHPPHPTSSTPPGTLALPFGDSHAALQQLLLLPSPHSRRSTLLILIPFLTGHKLSSQARVRIANPFTSRSHTRLPSFAPGLLTFSLFTFVFTFTLTHFLLSHTHKRYLLAIVVSPFPCISIAR